MPATVIETARAKINLTLRVLGRRPDGYHDLESLVAFAGVGDEVTFRVGAPAAVSVRGPFAGAIEGENIVARALSAIAEAAPALTLGAVEIDKRLPVAAGIGGGSADAAAVLRAVRGANPGRASEIDWIALAASLGADVPVCLASTSQLMWGIGRDTAPVPPFPAVPAVLVNPGVPLATAAVFRALAAPPAPERDAAPAVPGPFLKIETIADYVRAHGNDLESPAVTLCPAIRTVLAELGAEPGASVARMSGSGPTCFAIFENATAAQASAQRLRARNPHWWVVSTSLG